VTRSRFAPEFLRKLEQLDWITLKLLAGHLRGDKLKTHVGRSQELFDYRAYQHGDDLRYVDWNIFSRLDQLFVKVFAAEEDLSLHLLMDASASMAHGEPTKFDYIAHVGAALAYIGLARFERVTVSAFSNGTLQTLPGIRGRNRFNRVLDFLEQIQPSDGGSIDAAIARFSATTRHPGVVFILSDLLGDSLPVTGLRRLQALRHEVGVLHVLCEEDIAPPLDGDFRLVDSESASTVHVRVDQVLRDSYQKHLLARLARLQQDCARAGLGYVRTSTAIDFTDFILRYMREGSLLR
jgi:uncharacterized protein (DUF58 family)